MEGLIELPALLSGGQSIVFDDLLGPLCLQVLVRLGAREVWLGNTRPGGVAPLGPFSPAILVNSEVRFQ